LAWAPWASWPAPWRPPPKPRTPPPSTAAYPNCNTWPAKAW